jgi:hypothetical protein
MAGFDLGLGNSTVRLHGDEKNDSACNVHAAGEFGISGRDAGDDGPLNGAGKRRSGAEEETSNEEKGTGRSRRDGQVKPPVL